MSGYIINSVDFATNLHSLHDQENELIVCYFSFPLYFKPFFISRMFYYLSWIPVAIILVYWGIIKVTLKMKVTCLLFWSSDAHLSLLF